MGGRTRASSTAELAVREAIVDALSEAGLADDVPSRQLLLKLIGQGLEQPLTVADHSISRNYLIEVVSACAVTAEGLEALIHAVSILRPRSRVYGRVRQLVQEPQVRDVLPASELHRLRDWLAGTMVPQLPTLVHRAAGHGMVAAAETNNAWRAFLHLADLNAGPDGLPPALIFVELVACQVGGELGAKLLQWNNDQARRLRLEQELLARRANVSQVPTNTRLHLLIVIQHDGVDPDRWLLSHWRQDDPDVWPPAFGGSLSVTSNDLERATDSLVVSAEQAWSGHLGTAALEFVLPRELLNLPVHRWHKEHNSGHPRPLRLDYPIAVRSLERMRSAHWHRVWRGRWHKLVSDPSSASIHVGRQSDTSEDQRADAILNDPQWVMMILAAPPGKVPRTGFDELLSALRSGLPALAWHPDAAPDAVHEVVLSLTSSNGGLADLPVRLHARRNQDLIQYSDTTVISDLVLLWDDPFRLVAVDLGQPLEGERG